MEPRHAQARKKTSEEPRTGWWMDGYLRGEGGGAAEGEEGGGGGRGGAAVACRGKRGIRHRHLSLSAAVSLSRTQHTTRKPSPCARSLASPRRSHGSVFNGVPCGLAGLVNVLCLACARARARLYYRLCLSHSLRGRVAVHLARRRWWMWTRPTRGGGGGCGSQLVAGEEEE